MWVERGVHGPAPASASLHRLRRQTVLRGTVNPSSRQRVGGGANGPLQGALRAWVERSFPPPRSAGQVPYVCLHLNPRYTNAGARSGEQRASGCSQVHGGRGIDGPPQDSLRPKAVERSAGRRRTVDSSPLPQARKRSRHSRPGPLATLTISRHYEAIYTPDVRRVMAFRQFSGGPPITGFTYPAGNTPFGSGRMLRYVT